MTGRSGVAAVRRGWGGRAPRKASLCEMVTTVRRVETSSHAAHPSTLKPSGLKRMRPGAELVSLPPGNGGELRRGGDAGVRCARCGSIQSTEV